MISITQDRDKKHRGAVTKAAAVIFWIAVWQAASEAIGQEILLVSPVAVFVRLCELLMQADFWHSVGFSMLRILLGFLLGTITGILLAGLASCVFWIRALIAPAVLTVKAIPVASFVILVLIWVPSRNLSAVISFLMVFPILYTNVLSGIESTDKKLLEMAEVFRLSRTRRIRFIYIPQIIPFFCSACSVALGLCWKAGVAAEVIGIPDGSIGERLYQAKVYLDTPDLFAWTAVIIVVSLVFEKLFLALIYRAAERIGTKSHLYHQKRQSRPISVTEKPKDDTEEWKNLEVSHLYKSYGENRVLEDFCVNFPPGKITCIMAPSGKGKTTLLRILMGLEQPDSGEINHMEGRRISAVFQEDRLCPNLSAGANVCIALKITEADILRITEGFRSMNLPDDCITRPARTLSGGMKRRVAILRALFSPWDILILDEPFQGLDKETRTKVLDTLRRQCAGRTVICVTHEERDARELGAEIVRLQEDTQIPCI